MTWGEIEASRRAALACIYCIRHEIDGGKVYVGSTRNFKQRIMLHYNLLKGGRHHSPSMQKVWNEHGGNIFGIYSIEEIENLRTRFNREQFWIDKLGAFGPVGFNLHPSAGSPKGFRHSEETKQKIRMGILKWRQSKDVTA